MHLPLWKVIYGTVRVHSCQSMSTVLYADFVTFPHDGIYTASVSKTELPGGTLPNIPVSSNAF